MSKLYYIQVPPRVPHLLDTSIIGLNTHQTSCTQMHLYVSHRYICMFLELVKPTWFGHFYRRMVKGGIIYLSQKIFQKTILNYPIQYMAMINYWQDLIYCMLKNIKVMYKKYRIESLLLICACIKSFGTIVFLIMVLKTFLQNLQIG